LAVHRQYLERLGFTADGRRAKQTKDLHTVASETLMNLLLEEIRHNPLLRLLAFVPVVSLACSECRSFELLHKKRA
jgi:hypothetical protein